MRVLYFYCERFGLAPYRKGFDAAPDDERSIDVADCVVCFVHAEPGDGDKQVTKLIKNAKWIAGKFASNNIVLHFFSHLAEESAPPETAREKLVQARDRLAASGYSVELTPFGYFCRLDFTVHGESLAKVFKVF